MSLMQDVNKAIIDAMKSHDQLRLSTLRMLKAALVNREVERGRALEPGEEVQVVNMLVKQRHDSVDQFTKGGRADLAEREAAEIKILETYLPPSLDPVEIEATIDAVIEETGAASPRDLGRVMKAAMARLAGRGADGRTVNEIARRKLGG